MSIFIAAPYGLGWKNRPDRKGIKTDLELYVCLSAICWKNRPDRKGIKTIIPCSVAPNIGWKNRPDRKGIKTTLARDS